MFAGDLDRLPQYQNVAVDVDKLFAAEATLKGRDIRSSLGRVDDEKGARWSVTLDGSRVAGSWFARTHGTFDVGMPLPLAHSSVWLRTAAGVSPGSRAEPFANFFFGGFGNNWVDRGDEKRYRHYYAFPGAELNEISGRNFLKTLVEWNLPPLRFSRLGTPGFFVTWMRPALFAGALVDQPRSRLAPHRDDRRRAGGLSDDRALDARHDAVGRGGRRVRGRLRAAPGVHGLAQGPRRRERRVPAGAGRAACAALARAGLGTAILHGATTAVFALLAKRLGDRHPERPLAVLVPGLLAATAAHSLYNHFLVSPLLAAALLLVGLPLLVVFVFERSERATRDWLGVGLDSDLELVESISTGRALETRVGEYLRSLKARFPGEQVADMLCLLRIQAELAIRAKGLLLAREAGFAAPVGEDVRANLRELRYLERSIGPTGLLALKPLLRRSARDLWQVYFLEEAGGGTGSGTV
jgi:hypothetical protein